MIRDNNIYNRTSERERRKRRKHFLNFVLVKSTYQRKRTKNLNENESENVCVEMYKEFSTNLDFFQGQMVRAMKGFEGRQKLVIPNDQPSDRSNFLVVRSSHFDLFNRKRILVY